MRNVRRARCLAWPEDLDVAALRPDDGACVGPVGNDFAVPCFGPQGRQAGIVPWHELKLARTADALP